SPHISPPTPYTTPFRSPAFRHLAAPVGRERLEQPPQQMRPRLRHDVVDRHRAGDRRQPAPLRRLQTEQPDDIAGIGMEDGEAGRSEEHTSELQSPYDLV